MSELTHALRTPDTNSKLRVQRKCGCGGSCGSCSEDEKKRKVQRRATGEARSEVPRSVQSILGTSGRPLDSETRATMESRFGRSFADVRVHTDSHAAASAHDISAAAYTAGTHIVFGAGRFAPDTLPGRRLLAHELAHVAQQTNGASSIAEGVGPADDVHEREADRVADAVVAQGPAFVPPPPIAPAGERFVRRKREESESAADDAPRYIIDDAAMPAPGQMRRREFVEALDAAVCAVSDREMAALGQSTENCPLLAKWRPRIRTMDARELEVSMRRWIGDVPVRGAREYIPLVSAKLAESIRTWGATGDVAGVPADLLALFDGGNTIRIGVGSLIRGAVGRLFRKSRDGAAAPATDVAFDANGGRPLDNHVASRMGQAFGRDFSDVRVHTGTEAASAATRVNARAFTIGSDIAFAGGEYAPGTLIGDALLAHELAHVAQQDGAQLSNATDVMAKSDAATGELEQDADAAAVHAIGALWPSLRRFTRDMRANAMPRLKSSLKLQRCDASPAELQEYLRLLDRTKKIEGGGSSDDKARQIAEAWSSGDTQYILTARRKKLLIEEMLDGDVSPSDQKQILNLLEHSWTSELKQILGPGNIPHKRLLDEFGSWKEELWSFYMRRYPDAYPPEVQDRIDGTGEAPEPMMPPLDRLDATDPSTEAKFLPQFGDAPKAVTQTRKLETSRDRDARPTRPEATRWVVEVYGDVVNPARTGPAPVPVELSRGAFMERFVDVCEKDELAKLPEADRGKGENIKAARAVCGVNSEGVVGFHNSSDNSITLYREEQTPDTIVHEVLHGLADPRVRELSANAREGLTEFLTRRVMLRRKTAEGEKPLYIAGQHDDAYDAVQELAVIVGEDVLARVHFRGAVTELCNKLGKARFDEWNKKMAQTKEGAAATKILRGETPMKATTEKCE